MDEEEKSAHVSLVTTLLLGERACETCRHFNPATSTVRPDCTNEVYATALEASRSQLPYYYASNIRKHFCHGNWYEPKL